MLKNLLLQFYADVSCSFFGGYVWMSNFIHLLKDKEGSHKCTLFALPGFNMFDLLVVVFCCDLFHNAVYVCFSVLLLSQSRLTRLVRKHSSAK